MIMGKLHKIREYVMSLYFPVLLSIPISFSNTASFIEKYVFRDWEFLKYLMILIVIDTLVSWVYHIKNKDFSSKGFSMIITKLFIYSAILIVSHVMGNFTVEGGNVEIYTWFRAVVCNALIIRESISIGENTVIVLLTVDNSTIRVHLNRQGIGRNCLYLLLQSLEISL
jgi:phage-related holin